jgi:hypothetical protein
LTASVDRTASIDRRGLNRTVLHRQLLVERTVRSTADVVAHLVAMQSQEPNWPYVGLWSRIAGFAHDDLTAPQADGRIVRGSLVRATQHLTTAEDYGWLRPLVQPVLDAGLRSRYFTDQAGDIDPAVLAAAGHELLRGGPLTRSALGKELTSRHPGRVGTILAMATQARLPVVHPPPNGFWGDWGNRRATPMALFDGPLDAAPDPARLVRRYLTAFGPASILDVQAWSGLRRLREVVEGMDLRTLRDDQGRQLYDVPGAPYADGAQPVPVRFLPAYDNLLVGHADRTRVVSDDDRRRVITGGLVRPTFLVDGFVRGTWSVGPDGAVTVDPFRPLSADEEAEVEKERAALTMFVAKT